MKICYLADGMSIHTQRWCKHFASLGHEIHLITFRNAEIENCKVHYVDVGNVSAGGGNFKIIRNIGKVRRLVKTIKPDILHALYATSYGLAGARCNYHPFIVTALGTDVLRRPMMNGCDVIVVKHSIYGI